jgi:hypothetical protein
MALPDGYQWLQDGDTAYLRYNYGCLAVVRPGRVTIKRGRKSRPVPDLEGVCGSVEHGKRQVEARLAALARRRGYLVAR